MRAAEAGDSGVVRPGVPGDHAAIRPAQADDFAAILALNAAWVHYTSPLDEAALGELHAQAAYHRVAEVGGRIAGFLLAVGPGQGYESPNYRWFAARSHDFLYIDRVVVDGDHQGTGVGRALYDDVTVWAERHGFGRLVCEVNVEPPNPVSDAFHERRGFVEVGTQWVAGGTKRVSLRELSLGTGEEAAT